MLLQVHTCQAAESPSAFWSFVEAWQSPKDAQNSCWDAILSSAGQHVSSEQALSLQQAVASRQYTAKVEMLRNLAESTEDACCQAEYAGQHFSTAAQLASALKQNPHAEAGPRLYPFDHIYSNDSIASFRTWQAGNASGGGVLAYAVRPMLMQGCSEVGACSLLGTQGPLHLAGYGVELAIKNMEYSALDDSQVAAAKQAQQEAGGLEGGPEEVKGFLLGRLRERRPKMEQELLTFRDHLMAASSSSEDQTLKVWDLKDLGLQASQRIAQASDPLRLLTHISQNFPTLAASLSRLPVNASLAAEVRSNQRSLPAGVNVMFLNGLPVDVPSGMELYPLLERISAETRLTDMLKETTLQPEDIQSLLRLRASVTPLDSTNLRIDLAPYTHVHWINDLEKDRKRYRGFSQRVTDLLMPSFPGNLPSIARNLFNAVFVVDLASPQGIGVAEAVVRAIGSKWPVRIGLLPFVPDVVQAVKQKGHAMPPTSGTSPSAQAAQALKLLDDSFGASACLNFLSQLQPASSHATSSGPPSLTQAQLETAFTSAWDAAAGDMTNPGAATDDLELADIEATDAWQQLQDSSGVASGSSQAVVEATQFALSRGLVTPEEEGSLWLNGLMFGGVLAGPQQALMRGIYPEMQTLQEHVYFRTIEDDTADVLAQLLQLEGAVQHYNPRLLAQSSSMERQDVRQQALLGAGLLPTQGWLARLGYLYPPGGEDSITGITHWVCIDPDTQAGQGLLLAALEHIRAAPAANTVASRVGVLYNPTDPVKEPSLLAKILQVVLDLPSRRPKLPGFVTSLLSDKTQLSRLATSWDSALDLAQQAGLNLAAISSSLEEARVSELNAQLQAQAELTQKLLRLPAGSSAVVTNGRAVVVNSPALGLSDEFTKEDFGLLDLYASSQQMASGIGDLLDMALSQGRALPKPSQQGNSPSPSTDQDDGEGNGDDEEDELVVARLSNAALLASSILATHGHAEVAERSQALGQVVDALQGSHCAITDTAETLGGSHLDPNAFPKLGLQLPESLDSSSGHSRTGSGESAPASLHAQVVLNPLSKAAQRVAPILEWLRASFHVSIKVYLNPELDLSDMPLKSFYQYVLPEIPSAGGMPPPPAATFRSLPPRQILTLNFDAPEMWLVEPVVAEHDLDNLKLEQLGDASTLSAEFELEALMLTGRCIDRHSRRRDLVYPRGVQLHLGSPKQPHLQDTLVMSNLGYFQLKSAPGAWTLQLAPGRSRDLYSIQSSAGTLGHQTEAETLAAIPGKEYEFETAVAVSSLQGKDMLLQITKRSGFEMEDVLDAADDKSHTLWDRLGSWMSKPNPLSEPALGAGLQHVSGGGLSPEDDPNTIHIFSVASGHMYERLQKIMILSVIRHTRNPVKFWFIKNYMSPQMKRFVPEMAAHYNFHYQFVTYKWPSFLHKQTEKQRLIWAYKILFLDVLFPLNLRKVIFCDSDQVVRGDMAELWNLDLHGAPFGFTPFCDNNKDMEGFRFWKQGFWKEHLRGKPYHISALFVVDLARFRQTAAGDQLRVTYEQLSKDPNSLSNLDQDLPNYAQHSVPIHSLAMEWLWCETWCGNATKHRAKTIDLCNNPLTKEPKLQGARRIVSEWPALDEEARSFTAQVEGRLAAQASGIANQEHLEVQGMSNNLEDARHSSLPNAARVQPNSEMPSTLQYIAEQAGINHKFQKEVKSQRQDKSEL
ncbi:hypothetical protein ABBQ32_008463 [Trebouxia sp. C0010 RCD-2024]